MSNKRIEADPLQSAHSHLEEAVTSASTALQLMRDLAPLIRSNGKAIAALRAQIKEIKEQLEGLQAAVYDPPAGISQSIVALMKDIEALQKRTQELDSRLGEHESERQTMIPLLESINKGTWKNIGVGKKIAIITTLLGILGGLGGAWGACWFEFPWIGNACVLGP